MIEILFKQLLFPAIAVVFTGLVGKRICDKRIEAIKPIRTKLEDSLKARDLTEKAGNWLGEYQTTLTKEVTETISKTENLAEDTVEKEVKNCLLWLKNNIIVNNKNVSLSGSQIDSVSEKIYLRTLELIQDKLKPFYNNEEIPNRDKVLEFIEIILKNKNKPS